MMMKSKDSFQSKSELKVGNETIAYYRLEAVKDAGFRDPSRLPVSLRILLENLLRHEDGRDVTREFCSGFAHSVILPGQG